MDERKATLAMKVVTDQGGLAPGGLNFDCKVSVAAWVGEPWCCYSMAVVVATRHHCSCLFPLISCVAMLGITFR